MEIPHKLAAPGAVVPAISVDPQTAAELVKMMASSGQQVPLALQALVAGSCSGQLALPTLVAKAPPATEEGADDFDEAAFEPAAEDEETTS